MNYKTIVAIAQSAEDSERVLACAVPLARHFGAHVIGVHAEAMPLAYGSTIGFPDVEFLEATVEANKDRTEALHSSFEARMAAARQSFEWRALDSFAGDTTLSGATVARAADLVIAGQRDPQAFTDDAANLDGLLFEAGRPVLVVPFSGAVTSSYPKVLISWNGSRESARAVFDALPFIVEADAVEVMVVDPPQNDVGASAGDIAAALSRHGAHVTVFEEKAQGRNIDAILHERVAATGADLLVLGAYSHSWLRELLFGGVTRSILQASTVPTFMSR